ncbi:MAG: bifunctional adenosylcobinamide kinase/adenosylcobinamide-phosphate guanylyltransferase [Clostridiaceae bacterium]|nr:bifunctional adenosylcobinamide kinase/adenosylcobinamide-phosphate guanylyltransferase [Clostridiaceae bacterium]
MKSKQSLILVTGGARSGKSSFGESILKDKEGDVLYIATAQAFDDEMKDRIRKHREGRHSNWITFEGYKNLSENIQSYKNKVEAIFLDCVTIMVTNLMLEHDMDWDKAKAEEINELEALIFLEVSKLITEVRTLNIPVVLITNEVGLGIVPGNKMARAFRDIAGRVNQYIGREADEVYFVVCGIPNRIK